MNQATAPKPETIEVDDLDGFVRHLTDWHSTKVAVLNHIAEIPEGSKMQVGNGPEVVLAGDTLAGFKVGIALALGELGSLPFAAEVEGESTQAAKANG